MSDTVPRRPRGLRGDIWASRIALGEFGRQLVNTRQIRIQLVLVAPVVIAGYFRGFSAQDWGIMAIVVIFSIYAEINNSTHERMADLLADMAGKGADAHDPRIAEIKDTAAASVAPTFFLSLLVSIVLLVSP